MFHKNDISLPNNYSFMSFTTANLETKHINNSTSIMQINVMTMSNMRVIFQTQIGNAKLSIVLII